MQNLTRELSNLTNELFEAGWNLSVFEAMQIAIKMQHNRILSEAYVLGHSGPGALEKIAMELNELNNAIYSLSTEK